MNKRHKWAAMANQLVLRCERCGMTKRRAVVRGRSVWDYYENGKIVASGPLQVPACVEKEKAP